MNTFELEKQATGAKRAGKRAISQGFPPLIGRGAFPPAIGSVKKHLYYDWIAGAGSEMPARK